MASLAVSVFGWCFFSRGAYLMNEILEVLYAYAAVATIGSFLFDLWTEYKEHGRSRAGTKGKLK